MVQLIFIVYSILQFLVGRVLLRKLYPEVPLILEIIGSMLLGVFVSIPIIYVIACVFAFTKMPLLFGMTGFIIVSIGAMRFVAQTGQGDQHDGRLVMCKGHLFDYLLLLFSFTFSTWMTTKTFHGNKVGEVFVGSNNVFDFGILVGLVRSMSWGGNIPFMSPFNAGQPFFYHFFFQFWTSLWEYAGFPLVWAINIPSIFAFSSLLIIIYYLSQQENAKGRLTGWIAVILTITHGSLTFWKLLIEKGMSVKTLTDIWRLPTYPYAGPFDGSTISIFTTLNSYVNQRHLGFASAIGFFLFYIAVQKLKRKQITRVVSLCLGILTGILFLWNMAICGITGVIVLFLFLSHRLWKQSLFYILGSSLFILLSLGQYTPYFFSMLPTAGKMATGTFGTIRSSVPTWALWQYIWENLTIVPFMMIIGFVALSKKGKITYLSFLIFFVIECLLAGIDKRGFDQKFFSFLIIGVNIVVAVGISWLWNKRTLVYRVLALGIFFICTVSGAVDLMAIKNEFAYPLISKEMIPVVSWIRNQTPKDAVFVSYSDMIDPVVLSGRKNYFGFFGNVGWIDRTSVVKNIYAGDIRTAKKNGISYMLAPNWKKSDFPYQVDSMFFQEHKMEVYRDEKFTIYAVQ